jgi:hypothetical protein
LDELNRNFLDKPPWSGQSVRLWARCLAWLFLLFALLAGVLGATMIARDGGVRTDQLPMVLLFLAGELYFVVLLFHVAIRGVAPSSWLPWK